MVLRQRRPARAPPFDRAGPSTQPLALLNTPGEGAPAESGSGSFSSVSAVAAGECGRLFEGGCFCLDDCEPIAEGRSDKIGIGRGQRVLNGHVLVNPVRRLVRRLKLGQVGDQPVALRRGFIDARVASASTELSPRYEPRRAYAARGRWKRIVRAAERLGFAFRLCAFRRFGLPRLRLSGFRLPY